VDIRSMVHGLDFAYARGTPFRRVVSCGTRRSRRIPYHGILSIFHTPPSTIQRISHFALLRQPVISSGTRGTLWSARLVARARRWCWQNTSFNSVFLVAKSAILDIPFLQLHGSRAQHTTHNNITRPYLAIISLASRALPPDPLPLHDSPNISNYNACISRCAHVAAALCT